MSNTTQFCTDPKDEHSLLWVRLVPNHALPPCPARCSHRVTVRAIAVIVAGYVIILGGATALFFRGRRPAGAAHQPFITVAGTVWCTGASGPLNQRRQRMLFAWRSFAFLWAVGVLAHMYATVSARRLPWKLMYYTIWNYHLQLVYWGAAAAASGCWLLRARHGGGADDGGACCGLQQLVGGLSAVCTPASVLVSILLWGVLFPHAARHGDYSDLCARAAPRRAAHAHAHERSIHRPEARTPSTRARGTSPRGTPTGRRACRDCYPSRCI
eukprot:3223913-Prymnesium_polylepis.1